MCVCVCVCPSRRQSEKMLELVKMFLMKLPGAAERIVKKNRERLWLRGDAHRAEDVRKCSSYPSKVSTLKGVGGDLIICEEAAAMDTAVFYEVVVPLLELDKTALICISTILDSFNFYSKLLELKDENGDPFFVTHTFVMACDQCQADGTPEKCTHMFHSLPPWQSERKHLKIRAMMADQPELLARETMGLQSDTYQRAFATADLRAFRARPLRPPPSLAVQAVVVAIDPSGGGAKSHVAVVSCYWAAGHVVVAGLESIAARRPEDYETAIRDHVRLLAKTWPHAVLAVCPEANLGFESSHIARCVRAEKSVVVMYEAGRGCPGLCTTHKTKEISHGLLRDKLRDQAISFSQRLVSASGDPNVLRRMLLTQVQNFSVIVDAPDRLQHFKFTRKTYSGKHHGPDDLAMMLQMCLLARQRWVTGPKYRAYQGTT